MWARSFDKCLNCGTDERKHKAKGLCCKCYHKEFDLNLSPAQKKRKKLSTRNYQKNNPDWARTQSFKYRIRHPEQAKESQKKYRANKDHDKMTIGEHSTKIINSILEGRKIPKKEILIKQIIILKRYLEFLDIMDHKLYGSPLVVRI